MDRLKVVFDSADEYKKLIRKFSKCLSDSKWRQFKSMMSRYAEFNENEIRAYYYEFNRIGQPHDLAKLLFNMIVYKCCQLYDDVYDDANMPLYYYENNQNHYDLTTCIGENERKLLLYDLSIKDDNKVDIVFYDDILYSEKLRDLQIMLSGFQAEIQNLMAEMKSLYGGVVYGDTNAYLINQNIDSCLRAIADEKQRLYKGKEDKDIILHRKSLIADFTKQFDAYLDYLTMSKDEIQDGNKVLIKSYPYMDLSVCYKKQTRRNKNF